MRLFKGMANCGENKKFGKDFQLENERDREGKIRNNVLVKGEREKIFGHNRDKNCSHKKRKRESASVFVCDAWRRGKQTNDRKSDIFTAEKKVLWRLPTTSTAAPSTIKQLR